MFDGDERDNNCGGGGGERRSLQHSSRRTAVVVVAAAVVAAAAVATAAVAAVESRSLTANCESAYSGWLCSRRLLVRSLVVRCAPTDDVFSRCLRGTRECRVLMSGRRWRRVRSLAHALVRVSVKREFASALFVVLVIVVVIVRRLTALDCC